MRSCEGTREIARALSRLKLEPRLQSANVVDALIPAMASGPSNGERRSTPKIIGAPPVGRGRAQIVPGLSRASTIGLKFKS